MFIELTFSSAKAKNHKALINLSKVLFIHREPNIDYSILSLSDGDSMRVLETLSEIKALMMQQR